MLSRIRKSILPNSKDKAEEEEKKLTVTNTVKNPGKPVDPNACTRADLLKNHPKLSIVAAADRPALFVKKLRLCTVLFDWDSSKSKKGDADKAKDSQQKAKDNKREILLELVDFIAKNRAFINEAILIEIMAMVSANMFRTLPCNEHNKGGEDEEEPSLEPTWPHLQIVYEFFLRFIVSNEMDVKILKKHINATFVLHILELFDSEDLRERDYLKTLLHRIYAKFMSLRSFIRKAINNTFFEFIYETESFNGVGELLEILGSIINGFALPLKSEHKHFLERVLIPLHKVKTLNMFHQQLTYCMAQFVNKDATLAVVVIKGLLKFWPLTNSPKEVLFLNELEEVLENTQPEEFKQIMAPLFKTLSRTIGSPHFQVSERALMLFHNEYISTLIVDHRDAILPILYPVLSANSQFHWNSTVNNLSMNVFKIFQDVDRELCEKCKSQHEEQLRGQESERKKLSDAWKLLEQQVAKA